MSIFLLFLALIAFVFVVLSSSPALSARPHRPSPYAAQSALLIKEGLLYVDSLCSECPQQIFSSLSGDGGVVITWVTRSSAPPSPQSFDDLLLWSNASSSSLPNVAVGVSVDWISPIPPFEFRRYHIVILEGLQPDERIYYKVGSNVTNTFSDTLSFKSPPNGDEVLNMIVYGDLGIVNSQSLQYILNETAKGNVDIVLHLGDFAYDLHTDDGKYGDVFFNEIQPIASSVPYMGCEGNHEGKFNSTHYSHRFIGYQYGVGATSRSNTNWWFSWDFVSGGASVHMVAIDTEVYYDYVDSQYGAPPNLHDSRKRQYQWLIDDLELFGPGGKKQADWLVVYGHRPMYCSNTDDLYGGNGDCTSDTEVLRAGWGPQREFSIEQVLGKYGVHLYLSAHEHSYERIYPLFQGQLDPLVTRQTNHTYTNPTYPSYIVSGSAGCQEYTDAFDEYFYGFYSVVRSATYGYGRLLVQNNTHLYWEQYLDEGKGGKDYLWIVKDS